MNQMLYSTQKPSPTQRVGEGSFCNLYICPNRHGQILPLGLSQIQALCLAEGFRLLKGEGVPE